MTTRALARVVTDGVPSMVRLSRPERLPGVTRTAESALAVALLAIWSEAAIVTVIRTLPAATATETSSALTFATAANEVASASVSATPKSSTEPAAWKLTTVEYDT